MTEKQKEPKPAKTNSSGWINLSNILVILVALVVASAAIYFYYHFEAVDVDLVSNFTDQVDEKIQNLQSNSTEYDRRLEERIEELTENLAEQVAAVKKIEELVLKNEEAFQSQIESVMASISVSKKDSNQVLNSLMLEESIFLLSIADRRLNLTGDVESAIQFRNAVSEQLARGIDPRLVQVRNSIEEEIAQLRKIEPIDVTSISKKILTLANLAPMLTLRHPLEQNEVELQITEVQVNEDGESGSLATVFSELIDDVKQFVKIQKVDDDSALPFGEVEKSYLVQNLRQFLFAAQLAMLQKQVDVFRENLKHVQSLLDEYFSLNSAQVAAFSKSLRELSNLNFQVELPKVQGSLEQLRVIQAAGPKG